jgi:hypothetical protein
MKQCKNCGLKDDLPFMKVIDCTFPEPVAAWVHIHCEERWLDKLEDMEPVKDRVFDCCEEFNIHQHHITHPIPREYD